jgi:hypothetical protein
MSLKKHDKDNLLMCLSLLGDNNLYNPKEICTNIRYMFGETSNNIENTLKKVELLGDSCSHEDFINAIEGNIYKDNDIILK